MEIAGVVTDGRGRTVSIPQAYRFEADEVFINKIGEALILTPVGAPAAAFDRGAAMLTEDFLADGIPQSVPVERNELWHIFSENRAMFFHSKLR